MLSIIKKRECILLFTAFFLVFSSHAHESCKIAVIGTGYVGLVTGAGLAELGHNVCCVDIDKKKIDQLQQGIIPIYEIGLDELVHKNVNKGTLRFSTDIEKVIREIDIIFIAVGTPSMPDGRADLTAVKAVIEAIKENSHTSKIVCVKSTVPIGTCRQLAQMIDCDNHNIVIISNPEFLREGFAVQDFFNPSRIVVGTEFTEQAEIMRTIYAPFLDKNIPFLCTDLVSAEAIKYASNAFLAVKVTYINEIAQLCSAVGANINAVATGMGLDDRIGNKFLSPGPGFGGYCFPKDATALVRTAEEAGVALRVVTSCIEANKHHKHYIVQKTAELCGDGLCGKTVAVWGLAFKANTDDVRESAAIDIINEFLKMGATVKAYDPMAQENMKQIIPNILYCDTKEQVLDCSDVLVILTEWQEFKEFDYDRLVDYINRVAVIDTRDVVPAVAAKRNVNSIYKLGC